jgi:TatD DNase family protein
MEKFNLDREAVLSRAIQAGVGRILIPALTLASSRSVVTLAASHPILYTAIGVHPTEALTWTDDSAEELREMATASSGTSKIVAIGEIGLDYYWDTSPHDLQKKVLLEQLALAAELRLPVILHFREKGDSLSGPCSTDLITILREWVSGLKAEGNPLAKRSGVLHSFAGELATAREAIGLGFYIGVSGPVTYEKSLPRQHVIASLPMDRLLIETDAPFQSPHPHRGKRNEPAFVRLIADKIGALHSCPPEEAARATSENALQLFNWT